MNTNPLIPYLREVAIKDQSEFIGLFFDGEATVAVFLNSKVGKMYFPLNTFIPKDLHNEINKRLSQGTDRTG